MNKKISDLLEEQEGKMQSVAQSVEGYSSLNVIDLLKNPLIFESI